MNVFLTGYLDRNFGDDMMIRILANSLRNHDFYIKVKRDELFIPFENEPNIFKLQESKKIKFDIVLTVTGSGFIIRGISSVAYFIKEELERRKMYGRTKTAVIGCNIGPYNGSLGKMLIKWSLRAYQKISVRDRQSYEFAKKYAPRSEVTIYPDIVFALPEEWIPKIECEGHLGISAYRSGSISNLGYYTVVAKAADRFIEQTGKKVLLFAFDVEYENDLCAAHTILSLMKNKQNVEIIAHIDNGTNILRNLKRCGVVISGRFHMAVAAVRLGIPMVPLNYSDKTKNALKEVGYNEDFLKLNKITLDVLLDKISNAKPFKSEKSANEKARGHIECLKKMIE